MLEEIKMIKLDNGSELFLRNKTREDLELTHEFYSRMPQKERELMRIDVSDREVIDSRYDEIEKGNAERLVAIKEDKIVAEAILENMRYGWLRKTGEIRILILPEFRETGLADFIAREIFLLAARRGLNNLIARVLDQETEKYQTLKKLHFKHEATQKGHAVDLHDNTHDVHLMTFSLSKMWRDMEEAIRSTAPMG